MSTIRQAAPDRRNQTSIGEIRSRLRDGKNLEMEGDGEQRRLRRGFSILVS